MLKTQLIAGLVAMVGYRNQIGNTPLSGALTATTTGLTVDQCHDLLTLDVLRATLPRTGTSDDFKFENYLIRSRQDAAAALVNNLSARLLEAGLAAQMLRPVPFFKPAASPSPVQRVAGRTAGLRLTPLLQDVTVSIDRIKLTAPYNDELRITLLDETDGTTVSITPADSGSWQNTPEIQLRAGRSYLLTYPEDGLAGNAMNTVGEWPAYKRNCTSCKVKCAAHYLTVTPVTVTGDIVTETTNTNFGISLVVSAAGDMSGVLVDEPERLLTALKHQIAVTFLEKIAFTGRFGGVAEDAVQGALFALTDKDNADRVPLKLDRALTAVVKALEKEANRALDIDEEDEVTWGSL